MSGRVLIVEPGVGNRILLRGQLEAADYQVSAVTLGEARAEMAAAPPDVLLVGLDAQTEGALAFCAALRGSPDLAMFPVIALASHPPAALRQAALRAGADDIIDRDEAPSDFLAARMRSLQRPDDPARQFMLRPEAARALGMAEAATDFIPAGRTVILSGRPGPLPPLLAGLAERLPGGVTRAAPDSAFAASGPTTGGAADLFVIDAWPPEGGTMTPALTRLLARFRSDPRTHRARVIVAFDGKPQCSAGESLAALALDQGAHDVVWPAMPYEEIALRTRAQLRRKHQADRRRDNVQTGLENALHDPLTGLRNRRFATTEMQTMAAAALAEGRPMALILLDIDHFKRINDRYGHAAGDAVLRDIGARLRQNLRAVDLAARYGGEEFLLALPGTTSGQAVRVAERLLSLVASAACDLGQGQQTRVTLSAGVAELLGDDPDAALRLAQEAGDRALYAAKDAGRNRVILAGAADEIAAPVARRAGQGPVG